MFLGLALLPVLFRGLDMCPQRIRTSGPMTGPALVLYPTLAHDSPDPSILPLHAFALALVFLESSARSSGCLDASAVSSSPFPQLLCPLSPACRHFIVAVNPSRPGLICAVIVNVSIRSTCPNTTSTPSTLRCSQPFRAVAFLGRCLLCGIRSLLQLFRVVNSLHWLANMDLH